MADASLTGPLISGVFAFIGVILAQSVVIWSQRWKTLGEDVRRWHTERRTLYADLLCTAIKMEQQVGNGIDEEDLNGVPSPHDDDYVLEQLNMEIQLIASDEVAKAAEELNVAVFAYVLRFWWYAVHSEVKAMPSSEREKAQEWVRQSRVAFLQAARNELLYPGRRSPRGGYAPFSGATTQQPNR